MRIGARVATPSRNCFAKCVTVSISNPYSRGPRGDDSPDDACGQGAVHPQQLEHRIDTLLRIANALDADLHVELLDREPG